MLVASGIASLRLCCPAAVLATAVALALSGASAILALHVPNPVATGLLVFAVACPASKLVTIARVRAEAAAIP